MKMIANGFCIGKATFMSDGWNVLDGILVFISLVNVMLEIVVSGGKSVVATFSLTNVCLQTRLKCRHTVLLSRALDCSRSCD